MTARRPLAAHAGLASFGASVTPGVQRAIHVIEDLAMAAESGKALEAARAIALEIPEGESGDDDRIAVGEAVAFVAAAAGATAEGWALLEALAAQSVSPVARGALYFHRGRQVMEDAAEFLRLALGEFTRAGHTRGRAVTMAAMAWPTQGSGSPEHRLRLGRQALRLATTLDDPWALAYCAGRLAGTECYLADRTGLEHYAFAAEVLVADPDPQTAAVASLNQLNWGMSAFGYGDYADARRIFGEGRSVALGEEWRHWFDGALAMVDWRTGALRGGVPSAQTAEDWGTLGSLITAAVELETARRPETRHADRAVDTFRRRSQQMRWLALAIQARLRVVRNEPAPMRGLVDFVDEAAEAQIRWGWEDAAMTLAEHDPVTAATELRRLDDLWADYPRAVACRAVVESLLGLRPRYAGLVEAAEVFARLPEPVTAGRVLHLAAGAAPSVAEGNQLRRRAVDLLRSAGADRSLAAVLRDRTLHRGEAHEAIPDQLRGVVTGALTKREHEVAVLAAKGLTAQEIATELNISVWTARHHVQKAREKLGGVPKRKLGQLLAGPDSPL